MVKTISGGTRSRDKAILVAFLLSIFATKIVLLFYGLPYSFHPDELYIYKAPFKILLEYADGQFTTPTNLFFWILTVWYGLGFLVGTILGYFSNFSDFQDALLAEQGIVYFWGRLLSVVISLGTLCVLWKLIREYVTGFSYAFLLLCLFALNPIEWVSCLWLKFDPISLFVVTYWLFVAHFFLVEKDQSYRWKLYSLSAIGLCVRIDLVVLLLVCLAGDYFLFETDLRKISTRGLAVIGCYFLVTLIPFAIINSLLSYEQTTYPPFEQAILQKYLGLIGKGGVFHVIGSNFVFYFFEICLKVLAPIAIIVAWSLRQVGKNRMLKICFVLMMTYVLFLLVFPFRAPHYFLVPSILMMVVVLAVFKTISPAKQPWIIAVLLVFFAWQTIQIFYYVATKQDTRLLARDRVLSESKIGQTVALEGLLNNGFYPPVFECQSSLLTKAEVLREFGKGSGLGFEAMAKQFNEKNCRTLVELSYSNRLAGVPTEKSWINPFDPSDLKQRAPVVVVTHHDVRSKVYPTRFSSYIQENYRMVRFINLQIGDQRVELLLKKENFFPDFFIYVKSN